MPSSILSRSRNAVGARPRADGLLRSVAYRGAVAQLGERLTGSQKVGGSNPPSSTSIDEIPSYHPLQGGALRLTASPHARRTRPDHLALGVGEKLRIVPEGAREVSTLLKEGADALVDGGVAGVFTPMRYYLAIKPDRA